jgi:hypothetical protein
MNVLRIAGELFLLYLLYKLIFNFIIPVYQSSIRIKKQFGEMQNKMQEHTNNNQPPPVQKNSQSEIKEDYIDYEEIK